jgi:hypothetical protein
MCSYASRLVLLAAAIIAAPNFCGAAEEGKAEQPAHLSGSASANTTNSPSLKPKQNGLRQLEQDLFRPFENISPNGSLDGAFVPTMPQPQPNAPAVQSKRAKELLERRRDWVFETPEEILAAPSSDDVLKRRDNDKQGEDKSKLSPMERYYQRLYTRDKNESTRKAGKRDQAESQKPGFLSREPETADDDADLPAGVREAQRETRRLLAPKERKEDSSTESRNAFSDLFGLGKRAQTREEMETQKERMDRYKALVGLPVTPSLETDPLKPFRDIVGTTPKTGLLPTMDSLGTLPQQNINIFGVQSGSASITANPNLLPEGATIHTAPSLAPVLPKVEPPRTLPPPVTFNAPRRAF